MIPKTPEEMTAILKETLVIDLYRQITLAARRKRLTEHDIALIEQSLFREFDIGEKVAGEFRTFEAEPAVKLAIGIVRQITQEAKRFRADEIAKNP
jgi:hypothetical protein